MEVLVLGFLNLEVNFLRRNVLMLFFLITACLVHAQSTDSTYTGKVTEINGDAVIGAAVGVKGTTIATATDVYGNFKIVAPKNAIIVFSYIGLKTIEIKAEALQNAPIVLETDVRELEQVVVVGYGTQKKLDVTGAISSIKSEEIVNQASQNPVSSIQGRVAGVNIINNGSPGSSPQIRIRGVGSAQSGVDPLYIVDGVFVNDLSFLNPNDIESIDILKDASSAAIYGIRAANGVVLVTTKKGTKGKMQVTYNAFAGLQIVTNKVEMATAKKYAVLINEKLGTPTVGAFPTTDWYGEVLRNQAFVQNHQFGISGGSDKSTYNFSLGYLNQDGIVKGNNYERITARLQNDINISDFVKVGYNAIYTNYGSVDIPGNIFSQAFVAPPIIPVRESTGRFGDSKDYGVGNFANPAASLDWNNQKSRGQNLIGNIYTEIKFLKDFTFRSSFGVNLNDNNVVAYRRKDSLTSVQFARNSNLRKNNDKVVGWQFENTLSYDKTIAKHRFKALIGYATQSYKSEFLVNSINDVPNESPSTYYFSLGTPATATIANGGDKYTILSYFARVNYAFNDKYLLTATIRRDGSSKFPSDNRYANFPSIGLGWIVSSERFMENVKGFDLLKLKASWGLLGNSNVPSNITTQTVSTGGRYVAFFGGAPQVGSSITTAIPNTLLWEVVNQTDIGLEMAFLNSRLTVETDFYLRNTENAIFSVPILGSQGTSDNNILGNFATFENRGFEFSAKWRDEINDFKYNVGFNTSLNQNKVLNVATGDVPQLGGALPVGGYFATVARIGAPISSFFGYEVDGIFQTQSEVDASAQKAAKPGDFKYKDRNGDNTIDAKDKTIIGNPNPLLSFGITSGFNFKNFDFQLDIQGVAGVDIYNANKGIRVGNENFTDDFYKNRWNGPGTSNTYPSANLAGANLDPNSWFVEKGDYIRIRNVQLGYSIPNSAIDRLKVKKIRFYVNAQNPITLFTYKGFTPEIGATNNSPLSSGIDYNVYPLYATYNLGVNVIF
ncbi:MAG: SusC/RagA family TonB-linked outer membrane protein [Cytophagales bacterium]